MSLNKLLFLFSLLLVELDELLASQAQSLQEKYISQSHVTCSRKPLEHNWARLFLSPITCFCAECAKYGKFQNRFGKKNLAGSSPTVSNRVKMLQ